jgi:hypothetical protein
LAQVHEWGLVSGFSTCVDKTLTVSNPDGPLETLSRIPIYRQDGHQAVIDIGLGYRPDTQFQLAARGRLIYNLSTIIPALLPGLCP